MRENTQRFLRNTGVHEIYVNTAINDGSDIAELMQYFRKSVGEHENFMKLCKRVKDEMITKLYASFLY